MDETELKSKVTKQRNRYLLLVGVILTAMASFEIWLAIVLNKDPYCFDFYRSYVGDFDRPLGGIGK